jgi:hypothetical protein
MYSKLSEIYCHDITEMLLKVALNTITVNPWKEENEYQH